MIGGTAPISTALGDTALAAILCNVTGDFAAAGRMADMDGVLQVEMRGKLGDIGGVGVHFIAGFRLAGTAVSAAVMGDDAKTLMQEKQHLGVPVVGRKRPAVMEDDRLGILRTPVLVEDLRAVLGGDEIAAHGRGPFRK